MKFSNIIKNKPVLQSGVVTLDGGADVEVVIGSYEEVSIQIRRFWLGADDLREAAALFTALALALDTE